MVESGWWWWWREEGEEGEVEGQPVPLPDPHTNNPQQSPNRRRQVGPPHGSDTRARRVPESHRHVPELSAIINDEAQEGTRRETEKHLRAFHSRRTGRRECRVTPKQKGPGETTLKRKPTCARDKTSQPELSSSCPQHKSFIEDRPKHVRDHLSSGPCLQRAQDD